MNRTQLSVMNEILTTINEKIDPDIKIEVDNAKAPAIVSPIAVDDIAGGRHFCDVRRHCGDTGANEGAPPAVAINKSQTCWKYTQQHRLAFSKQVST